MKSLFLLNDLLRYWRAMSVNYEERHAKSRSRKRTVDLKSSEMVTVFITVLAVATQLVNDADHLVSQCRLPPFDRLAIALDRLEDAALTDAWPRMLEIYEESLAWKDDQDPDTFLAGATTEQVNAHAEELSTFLYGALTHQRIRPDLRRFLGL